MATGRIFKVSCPKIFGTHVGILVEGEGVFHNAPGKGEHLSSLAQFHPDPRVITFEAVDHVDFHSIIDGINAALMKPKGYSASSHNCEDSVNSILEGRPHSPQRQKFKKAVGDIVGAAACFVVIVGAVAIAGAAVSAVAKSSRS